MEQQESGIQRRWNEFAAEIYVLAFFLTIIEIFFILIFFIMSSLTKFDNWIINIISYIIIGITYIIAAYSYGNYFMMNQKLIYTLGDKNFEQYQPIENREKYPKWFVFYIDTIYSFFKLSKKRIPKLYPLLIMKSFHDRKKVNKFNVVFLLTIFFILVPIFLSEFVTLGYVNIDLERIQYKNDAPIPVSIKITGPIDDISVKLQGGESIHKLTQIDYIILKPIHNPEKIISGENSTLIGNPLIYGTYNVFISTKNLTVGYYELIVVRNEEYIMGFYLSNNS